MATAADDALEEVREQVGHEQQRRKRHKEAQAWDRYAAHAAAGILAGRDSSTSPAPEGRQQYIARDAARIADRLLIERRLRF